MATTPAPRRYRARKEGTPLDIVSPEGVPLHLNIASQGARLTAFLLDSLIIGAVVAVLVLLETLLPITELQTLTLIGFFLVRNFYFMFFEQRWQGATPGKRNLRLQVIDARGGQLTVEAIIVRNLTRDVEIFLPLTILVASPFIWPDAPGWVFPLAMLWALVLGLFPVFNKQRQRIGDLVAGTLVIAAPQVALLGDLAASEDTDPTHPDGAKPVFTRAQLAFYGIYELQVLEKILREADLADADQQRAAVRENICRKIGWRETVTDDIAFLKAFYAAQRAHLEDRLLMGKRREDKFDGTSPAALDDQEK